MNLTTLDWAVKADTYASSGNIEQARACISEGEKVAGDILEWSYLADSASRIHPSKSKEYLIKMEALAQNVFDFYVCATTNDDAGNMSSAKAHMEKAESLANYTFEWLECVSGWFSLNDLENHHRCLLMAEKSAKDSSDWCSCAAAWFHADKENQSKRCVEQAKQLASSVSDLCGCALMKSRINSQEAKEIILRAEKLAAASQDWFECENVWRLIDDAPQAERCKKLGDEAFRRNRSPEAQNKILRQRQETFSNRHPNLSSSLR